MVKLPDQLQVGQTFRQEPPGMSTCLLVLCPVMYHDASPKFDRMIGPRVEYVSIIPPAPSKGSPGWKPLHYQGTSRQDTP